MTSPVYDLIIRAGRIVTEGAVTVADIAVSDGRITAIEPDIAGMAQEEVDARDLHVFPGVIDAHVHFNEPGRGDWEGWAHGSQALAAGGGTCCFDMPLNAHPPTLDGPSFDAKRAAAEASALTDFALWGGLTPANLDRLDELAERGVVGLKAFMSHSGIPDFPAADDLTLLDGMRIAARLGLIVAVHAENDTLTRALAAQAVSAGRTGAWDYLASRPAIAEVEAIARAILFAEETGCALHVVHVSTGRGLALIASARARGVDVSCETCPHYLVFTEDDLELLGAVAKCAPPLRPVADQEALWQGVMEGTVAMIASDHSPSPPELKSRASFFDAWGGISGCQSLLPALLTAGHHQRGVPLERIATLVAGAVARRFRIPGKGQIAVDFDADLALVRLGARATLRGEDLCYRHRQSPYVGMTFADQVVRTIRRGVTIARDGKPVASGGGRLVRPVRNVPAVSVAR